MELDYLPEKRNSLLYPKEDNSITEERLGNETKPIDLDTILVKDIGQFGLFQLRTIVLAALAVLFTAWSDTQYVFTTARINTRCLIPECETTDQSIFSPPWIMDTVPSSGSAFDNCQRYASFSNSSSIGNNGTCPANFFDHNNAVSCNEYVYENKNTIVYDYDLACQEWRRSLVGSVRKFGTLVSHPITGYISDRWGRRNAMAINAFNTAWLGILRYWADTYVGFTTSQFFEAAFGFGAFSCAYIMSMELVETKFRVAAGATMSTFFALGQVTVALIAWAIPNWRILTLTIYIPQILTLAYFWIMPESARWYMSKDRFEDCERVLKTGARVNGKELSQKALAALREAFEIKRRNASDETKKKTWLLKLVFQNKAILIRCLITPVWWITAACVYYGLSINSVNLVGNQYLNYLAVAAVEIPGFWTVVYLLDRIGRKPTLIAAYWICGVCLLSYSFTPKEFFGLSLTLYLISKYCISGVMTAVNVYTAELYPTPHRHSLFAFGSMMGRIGSTLAPLSPALAAAVWENLPFVLFASLTLLSGVLVFFTPDTMGCKLPDTMEEAVNIGKKKGRD